MRALHTIALQRLKQFPLLTYSERLASEARPYFASLLDLIVFRSRIVSLFDCTIVYRTVCTSSQTNCLEARASNVAKRSLFEIFSTTLATCQVCIDDRMLRRGEEGRGEGKSRRVLFVFETLMRYPLAKYIF